MAKHARRARGGRTPSGARWTKPARRTASRRRKSCRRSRFVQTGASTRSARSTSAACRSAARATIALRLVPAIEPTGTNRVLYNDEFLSAEVGQVGTQFDGLGHIGGEVRYADGSLNRVFYNGFTTAEMNAGTGLAAARHRAHQAAAHARRARRLAGLQERAAARRRLRGDARRRARRARAAGHRRELDHARRRRAVPLRLGAALDARRPQYMGARSCPASASKWRAGSSSAR